MRFSRIILLLAIVAVASAAVVGAGKSHKTTFTRHYELDNYTFEDYITEYKKDHLLTSNGEYSSRKQIFEENLAKIKQHNANPHRTWNMGVNQYTDMTEKEFLGQFTGYNQGMAVSSRKLKKSLSFTPQFPAVFSNPSDFPTSVDWRNKGVTTPVKNQGQCGSCWAFASTAVYETAAAIATGKLMVLSTQQFTSCTPNPDHCGGDGGCAGATCELAFEYASKGGITTNDAYPYVSGSTGATGTCQFPTTDRKPVVINSGYVQLPTNNLTSHLEAINTVGTLGVSVAASQWMFYESGIFSGCSDLNNVDVNHAVVMEGYGEENGQKYWLIRNSWGPNWGENGYIRLIRRDKEVCGTDPTPEHGTACEGGPSTLTVCGECGVLSDTSYPTGLQLA